MDRSNPNEEDFAVDLENGRCEKEDNQASSSGSLLNYDADLVENVVIHVKLEVMDADEKKSLKEKKPPKPPRPPRGPTLDAADQKLIREIAELTMLKRVRTERIKALKKIKAAKPSSSSNGLFAMIFTIVFCSVILLHGISNRTSSHASLDGSPSSSAPEPGLISVQYDWKASSTDSGMPASGSHSLVAQISGQDPHEKAKSVSG